MPVCISVESSSFKKDTDAILDYVWDWSDWLGDDNDTIVASQFIVSDPALQITMSSNDTTTAHVWLSGGVAYTTYVVTCRITTSGGRTEDRSIQIMCVNR